MGYIKTQGLVIKEVNTGEADKIITLLSRDHGKIQVFAKGARRPRSQFTACTRFLCFSEFTLFKGRDMHTINSCEVIEAFSEAGKDLIKLTYASHIIDIIFDTVQEEQSSSGTLKLLLYTLYYLFKTDKSPELITRIFELRYLCILGYSPHVTGCVSCVKRDLTGYFFSFNKCGFLCGNSECICKDASAIKILPGTARALHHIVYSKMNKLFGFDLAPEVLKELKYITARYLRERLDKEYKGLNFLKSIDIT
ncbi:MAG TPA: DNA repair protein RecO [Clostridiales bacterium]|nr:DNA repair protein RecO [Clostridiales bacterium]